METGTARLRRGTSEASTARSAIDEATALVAVSEVLSIDGERVDLARLRAATDAVGARLFVDLTQSLGVLRPDLAAVRPD